MSNKLFDEQVAIVTGAGLGIGYEISRQLALLGAKIILNDVDKELAETASAKIGKEGGNCHAFPGDASELALINGMIAFCVEQYGRLDLVVANAGITLFGDFLSYPPESFYRVMQVNLGGSFFLTQQAALQMKNQPEGGSILLMSSVTGQQAHKNLAAYSMTKAALQMLAKNLVVELAQYHINVNSLAPGATLTERTMDDPSYEKTWAEITPDGRAGTTLDIAQAALFLLSKNARHITGQTLVIDGGWSAVSPSPYSQ
jgi:glucose 1-dehydrogenase